jgi:hypothetical protein
MGTWVDRVSQGAGLEAGVFVSDARECGWGEHVRSGVIATRPKATTGIRLFAECSAVGALPSAFCRALGKEVFVECRTRQSPALNNDHVYREQGSRYRNTLGKETCAECQHSAKNVPRQRAVSRRLKLTAIIFVERRALVLSKEAALLSVRRLTLGRACYAECQKWYILLCRELCVECHTRQSLCRVFFRLCRVLQALGKALDSGSERATHDVQKR